MTLAIHNRFEVVLPTTTDRVELHDGYTTEDGWLPGRCVYQAGAPVPDFIWEEDYRRDHNDGYLGLCDLHTQAEKYWYRADSTWYYFDSVGGNAIRGRALVE